MKKCPLLLLCLIALAATKQANAQTGTGKKKPNAKVSKVKPAVAQQHFAYIIIPAENNTFGYDILSDNKKLIHQPSIPGLAGNKGFATKQDAEKVAKLVMNKVSHNIMPPTVERRELDSLKIKL